MAIEADKDGNLTFNGRVAIDAGHPGAGVYVSGGTAGDSYSVTFNTIDWQPVGYISEYDILTDRVVKLERLVKVLADALGVNEEFLSSVAEGA